jgi:hypothetical protein
VIVHHIEMHNVGACVEYRRYFLAEPREIGGENRGSNEKIFHAGSLSGDQAMHFTDS